MNRLGVLYDIYFNLFWVFARLHHHHINPKYDGIYRFYWYFVSHTIDKKHQNETCLHICVFFWLFQLLFVFVCQKCCNFFLCCFEIKLRTIPHGVFCKNVFCLIFLDEITITNSLKSFPIVVSVWAACVVKFSDIFSTKFSLEVFS